MSNLADQINQDVLEAQKFSRKHLVLELDFSAGSIRAIEDNVDSLDYAIPGGKSSENVDLITRIWGAYLGESLRQQFGGEWTRDESGQIGLRGDKGIVFPHQQVRRRLTEGSEHNLADYFEHAGQRL